MSIAHLVALTHFYKIGPVSYQRLVAHFGAIENAWNAPIEGLVLCLPENLAREFVAWRCTVDPHALHDDALHRGMTLIAHDDPAYPVLLSTIHDPPYLLYVRGTLPPADAMCVGIVGSRRATPYGLQAARTFAQDLAQHVVIVSGLADGIDDAAHHGALTGRGSTVAVLAGGLDGQDRERKQTLADEIVAHGGAIISEFAPETPPVKHLFPIRNRIIAGMSKAVLIVEAAEKSGSLITARVAMEEGRDVCVVPGSIFSDTSEGTNRLAREGAHIATRAIDVLDVLGLAHTNDAATHNAKMPPPNVAGLSEEFARIVCTLTNEPQHVDDIARKTALPTPAVLGALTLLELEGHVRHLGGMRYMR